MTNTDYIGFDVHKKSTSYCIKAADGTILEEGKIAATRSALDDWAAQRSRPWKGALEATLFTGWIYDALQPHAEQLQVAHPMMLKAITAAKKKNDEADARTIADLLRTDLLPVCYMAPTALRELRRVLRFRNLIVRLAVQLKNRMAGMLMEVGVSYTKQRLHQKGYFQELVGNFEEVPESVVELLRVSRTSVELFESLQQNLLRGLSRHELLAERVKRLETIGGVGPVTALSWALEVGEPHRFGSIARAVSYCGLCSAQRSSAGVDKRGPISKQRNKHLQWILIEAAKLAPQWNPALAALRERKLERGHRNRATLAVARKLVAYLLAVDRRGEPFVLRTHGK